VFSYRKGLGIRALADRHVGKNYLLRVDLEDFFPSLKQEDVTRLLKENTFRLPFELDEKDIQNIGRIVCRNGALTIGAPSSPLLSNALLYDFDDRVHERSSSVAVVYTRYADDLFFSTNRPRVLREVLKFVEGVISKTESPKLRLNVKKTAFSSRKWRMLVTGLVLTPDGHVSLGRQKKRHIRGLVHKFQTGKLDASEVAYLRGYIAYTNAVNPEFVGSLQKKFGAEVMAAIANAELLSRKDG
jgi:hypothetical protein